MAIARITAETIWWSLQLPNSSNHRQYLDQHCTECGLNSSTYKSISIKIDSYPFAADEHEDEDEDEDENEVGDNDDDDDCWMSIDDNRDHHLDAVTPSPPADSLLITPIPFTPVDVYADINEVYVYVNSVFMPFLFIFLLFMLF